MQQNYFHLYLAKFLLLQNHPFRILKNYKYQEIHK